MKNCIIAFFFSVISVFSASVVLYNYEVIGCPIKASIYGVYHTQESSHYDNLVHYNCFESEREVVGFGYKKSKN